MRIKLEFILRNVSNVTHIAFFECHAASMPELRRMYECHRNVYKWAIYTKHIRTYSIKSPIAHALMRITAIAYMLYTFIQYIFNAVPIPLWYYRKAIEKPAAVSQKRAKTSRPRSTHKYLLHLLLINSV